MSASVIDSYGHLKRQNVQFRVMSLPVTEINFQEFIPGERNERIYFINTFVLLKNTPEQHLGLGLLPRVFTNTLAIERVLGNSSLSFPCRDLSVWVLSKKAQFLD